MRPIVLHCGIDDWNRGKFVFPKNAEGQIEMSREHFNWLLMSDKYSRMDTLGKKVYENYY